MDPINDILIRFPVVVLDGAFATQLEKYGCDLNDPLWSAKVLMESPELVQLVHREYYEAGADCVITASYQATYEGFRARGMTDEQAGKLIKLSVILAQKARDDFWADSSHRQNRPYPLVAASVGPYGAYLADGSEYRGDYGLDEEQLMKFHRRRLATLIEAKPDLLACETLPCFVEAKALVRLMDNYPEMQAWISFTAKDGLHTRNGEKIRDCAEWLARSDQVAAIGINCTEPQYVVSLIQEIRSVTDKTIIVYPNSGEQYDPVQKSWMAEKRVDFVGLANDWYNAGAKIIGGCCRTGPDDIKGIRDRICSSVS